MQKSNYRMILATGLLLAFGWSCGKTGFLDQSPSTQLVLPNTLTTLQALLDKDIMMNVTPTSGELSADNFYLSPIAWESLDAQEHNAYIWVRDFYAGTTGIPDWDQPYQQVFVANTVLTGLAGLSVSEDSLAKAAAIRGAAYFFRAYAFYQVAQLFGKAYDPTTDNSETGMGIPLRLSPAIEPHSVRATVAQTYKQILDDLDAARNDIDPQFPMVYRNRPSLPALQAFRARVYLSMGDYGHARMYADSALLLYHTLIDYNSLNPGTFLTFNNTNDETIFQGNFRINQTVLSGFGGPAIIDSALYASYAVNDLRRSILFIYNGQGFSTKGTYSGSVYPFSGLATDEVLLIRAESAAVLGDKDAAMSDLNLLLRNRYKTGSFTDLQAADAATALGLVRTERRKELFMRGLRWTDLRRMNGEGAGIVLKRILGDSVFILRPRDARYTIPIPPDVITLNPGMQQNPE